MIDIYLIIGLYIILIACMVFYAQKLKKKKNILFELNKELEDAKLNLEQKKSELELKQKILNSYKLKEKSSNEF